MNNMPAEIQETLTQQWNNMGSWFQQNLTAGNLNNQVSGSNSVNVPQVIGCCYLLAIGAEGVDYQESGTGNVTYSGFSISQFTGVSPQAITFPDRSR